MLAEMKRAGSWPARQWETPTAEAWHEAFIRQRLFVLACSMMSSAGWQVRSAMHLVIQYGLGPLMGLSNRTRVFKTSRLDSINESVKCCPSYFNWVNRLAEHYCSSRIRPMCSAAARSAALTRWV
jgi:hypothetical protein